MTDSQSERMTVEEAFRWFREYGNAVAECFAESGGDCGNECYEAEQEAERLLKQAILDEGLKEYQEAIVWFHYQTDPYEKGCPACDSEYPDGPHADTCVVPAALAAVRESQVSEGGV